MRYTEFNLTEDELFELKMSPTNLKKMAKDIDAAVGMEFELIIPEYYDEEEEYDSEPDYDADESFPTGPGWQRDILSFFRGGEMGNSTGMINRAIESLQEDFWGWMGDATEEFISSPQGQERAIEIAQNNVDRDDYETDEEYDAAVRNFLDSDEDRIRDQLTDEFQEDADYLFEKWLEEEADIRSMSQFADQYNLDWPYWTEPERRGGNINIDAIADDFQQAIDRPVNASSSYHGARREPGHYVVEPDSSLHGDDGESGLEFVSPPLPVSEMISDLDKVAKWAGRVGAYTNDSTGLHMNVSVPNQQNLDYVKLAMFLGDDYILEQFGREGNTYAKSALKKIKSVAATNPDRVEEMMRQFQGGLNQLASKILHTGSTDKYTSINNRGGWIEFRGPGGDWLGEYAAGENKVVNTVLRAVVALDVATKPEAYKQEYYKKLYKTLNPKGDEDAIQYFAKYAAGELPASALKSFVRQLQTQRKIKKQGPGENEKYWWNVKYDGQRIEVVATSAEEAKKVAAREWGEPFLVGVLDRMTAEPLRPYQPTPTTSSNQEFTGIWEVVSRNTDEVVHRFSSDGMTDPRSVAEAEAQAARWVNRSGFDDPVYVRPYVRQPGQSSRSVPGSTDDLARQRLAAQLPRLEINDGNWEIYSISSGNSIYRFIANTEEEAVRAFNIWQEVLRNPTLPREAFNLRAVQPQGTAQPQAQGTGSLPPGNQRWLVLDRNGNEVYSFVNTTYQSDANQYALQWMTRSAPADVRQRGPFEVVPAR